MADIDWKSLIGAKSFDELRLAAFEQWQASGSKITNLNVGGVFRTLLELAIQGLAKLYELLLEVVPKGFLKYATGSWLDLKGEERNLPRKLDQKAEGLIIFGRYNATGNKVISAGIIVKTDMTANGEELRYFVKDTSVCLDGIAEIAVPCIAEFTGAKYNVGQGAIKNMVTHVSGFDYVTNAVNWLTTEGADIESDEAYIERCQLYWYELSIGEPALKYKSWAMKVIGVVDVIVLDQHPRGPGTIDIVILSTAGMPTTELISQVRTEISSKRPTCQDILYRGPLTQAIDLSILIELMPESTIDTDTMQSLAEQYSNAHFGNGTISGISRLKLSQDFVRLVLEMLIKNISPENIKTVKVLTPVDDISIADGHLAVLQSLNISVERALEE